MEHITYEYDIYNGIYNQGIYYIINSYKKYNLCEKKNKNLFEKIILNYFKLIFFNNIFDKKLRKDFFTLNLNSIDTRSFLDFIINKLTYHELKEFVNIFDEYVPILSLNEIIINMLFFMKYNKICKIYRYNLNFIKKNLFHILLNGDCKIKNNLILIHIYLLNIAKNISSVSIIHELSSYINKSNIYTTLNFQQNEPFLINDEYLNNLKISNNVLYILLQFCNNFDNKIYEGINIEYILDPICDVKNKNLTPINYNNNHYKIDTDKFSYKKQEEYDMYIESILNNISFESIIKNEYSKIYNKNVALIDKQYNNSNINNIEFLKKNTNYIVLPLDYTFVNKIFCLTIFALNNTVFTFKQRTSNISSELYYIRKDIKRLNDIKKSIINTNYISILEKYIQIKNDKMCLYNKYRYSMYSLTDSNDIQLYISNYINIFANILERSIVKNNNIIYNFPQELLINSIDYSLTIIKEFPIKNLFNLVINLLSRNIFPNCDGIYKMIKYSIIFSTGLKNIIKKKQYIKFLSNIINFSIDIEKTQPIIDFYERIEYRYYINDFIYRVLKDENFRNYFILGLNENIIIQYSFLILNDYNCIIDEIFEKIYIIHDNDFDNVKINIEIINKYRKTIRLLFDHIECISDYIIQVSKYMPYIFTNKVIVEKLVNIINNNISRILGKNKLRSEIRMPSTCNFDKNKLLNYYIDILNYIFGQTLSNNIIKYIKCDTRSYKRENYINMINTIKDNDIKKNILNILVNSIDKYDNKLYDEEIPDELCDPLLSTLIEEPIVVPISNIIVDKNSIYIHLMSSNTNPFNRDKLTIEDLEHYNKNEDILQRINIFKKKIKKWKDKINH